MLETEVFKPQRIKVGGYAMSGKLGHVVRKDRRMALLKRAGLFSNDTQGATIVRATTVEDLLAAYKLTHDVFVEQGYINPDVTGIRIRPFEALAETATFVAKGREGIVGVTTVAIDSKDMGLPTDKSFAEELDSLRKDGRIICEGTNWLVAPSHRSSAVMSELMRCSFAHAVKNGCTDFIGTVSPGHARFYNLLGFETIGSQRSYSDEIDDQVVLVRLDLLGLGERFKDVKPDDEGVEGFLKKYYIADNPYHRYISTWQMLSDRLFDDPDKLREMFVDIGNFLPRCDANTLETVASRWGNEML
ncbi:MAG TPA: hypothetical protein ENL03_04260, partial [Phycisphaerae bacterium]|nr:hypothetical protein [Phycisphaerae bacterium]